MSSSVIIEKQHYSGAAVEVSRAIPGGSGLRPVRREKPVSIRKLGQSSPAGIPKEGVSKRHQSFVRSAAEILLPHPRVAASPWRLWQSVVCDFLLVACIFVLVTSVSLWSQSFFRLAVFDFVNVQNSSEARRCLGFGVIYGALLTLLAYSEGLYQKTVLATGEEIGRVFKSVWLGTLVTGVAIRVSLVSSPHLGDLVWSAALSITALLGWRWWGKYLNKEEPGRGIRNVLVVGYGSDGRELAQYFAANPESHRVVRGFLDEHAAIKDEVLGRIDDLPRIARAHFIDEVIVMPAVENKARRVIRVAQQNCLDVWLVPELFDSEPEQTRLEWLGHLPLIVLHEERLPEFALFTKRVLDLLFSTVLLVLLFPLMTLIALLIKLDTPGALLYRAPRVGRKGRRFCCYKFRTMATDADQRKENLRGLNQREGPCFKIANDPRVTRVGRFLRRYSLDEFPQLWNVFRGDMSLVGPRPHPLDDVSRYELAHLRRLDVTPGITGLWQVKARQDPSFMTTLMLDLKYIEEWSLWLDIRILLKTFSAVVAGTGV